MQIEGLRWLPISLAKKVSSLRRCQGPGRGPTPGAWALAAIRLPSFCVPPAPACCCPSDWPAARAPPTAGPWPLSPARGRSHLRPAPRAAVFSPWLSPQGAFSRVLCAKLFPHTRPRCPRSAALTMPCACLHWSVTSARARLVSVCPAHVPSTNTWRIHFDDFSGSLSLISRHTSSKTKKCPPQ